MFTIVDLPRVEELSCAEMRKVAGGVSPVSATDVTDVAPGDSDTSEFVRNCTAGQHFKMVMLNLRKSSST